MADFRPRTSGSTTRPGSSGLEIAPQLQPRPIDPAMWSQRLCRLLQEQYELADKLSAAQDGKTASLFDGINQRHNMARDLQFSVRDYSRMRRRVFERLPADVQETIKREEARARTAVARALALNGGGGHA